MILSKMTPSLHIFYDKTLTSIKHDRFFFIWPQQGSSSLEPFRICLGS